MPWTLASCSFLGAPLSAGQTALALENGAKTTELCALLTGATPHHVILEIYSTAGAETVAAYGCKDGKIQVVRGLAGTSPRDWAATGCIRTLQIVEGALCSASGGGAAGSDPTCPPLPSPWTQVQVCPEIKLDLTDPLTPILCLRPTGVVAGDYCGMQVNAYGQITYIPQSYPATCIPIFDPCCGDTGTGGGNISLPLPSTDVSYSPAGIPHYLSAGTLQTALGTIDNTLFALQGQIVASAGVQSVTGEPGQIVVTGPVATPVVGLAASGVSPGTYNGFTVDAFGRITSATASTGFTSYTFAVTGALTVAVAGSTVTYGIPNASQTNFGAVQYVDVADVINGVVPPGQTLNALSYAGGQALVNQMAKTATAGVGLSGGGPMNANITFNMNIPGLPPTVYNPNLDEIALYSVTGGQHAKVNGLQFAASANTPIASAVYNAPLTTFLANRNVASITSAGAVYTVTLAVPMPSISYVVAVAPEGPGQTTWFITRVSSSVFQITFATSPSVFGFTVSSAG